MLMYKYVGRTKKGLLKKGTIEGSSRSDVIAQLRGKEISPREITETKATIFNKDISIGRNSVKNEHFVIYCRQFATLIRAGVTIVEATNILRDQTESKGLKKVLGEVERDIKGGIAFSDAVEKHPKAFPTLFANMIRAGEMTGNLDETLDRMATYFEKQHSLKKKIQSTLAYPIVLSVLIFIVVIFLMVFVIPQFTIIYEQFGGGLPSITLFVLKISEMIQHLWWLLIFILAVVIALTMFLFRKNHQFHYIVHSGLLKMPIFGKLLQKAAIARMTRTLSSLFSSAVPILQALAIVAKVVNNPVISKVILESRGSLESGGTLSEPLSAHWVFPPLVHQMTEIGEKTGTLDYMLEKIADFYEEDVDRTVDTLKSLIEPVMIVILAFVVGFIVAAIMIPMFSVFTEIQ
ncbi:type II secretion system F family protein [Pseudogracilibacillus auburnensis]|uniref:Type IV pilus assembly protein PilC n=1 Tax=Pseudogracilibacillus auburnensis TaxID=1494959 RepID=A0A2V3W9A2_9BACI|nr:type II secretion system F family protein [Pseudogracilibacillus auburnensis]MBO1003377.1 type II secretion system F family protein [Pseudogracilibacillus auburnensis]PXW85319.1 type IV pilus assembly protein PilC [Pseudogracilibacillus auburnensis]